ncbi:Squamosa promoter-binding-like protein 13A [Acorus gramineus]|uniref:Squamosa promoter-binding-like protein 13A n=1 Tax=Acorus gramineus TaxID=55184 RepID=A0AAV9A1T0_ACOGR|nr:Squamosa promoter-binding-like protein 13A [Acorus gramineus]
MKRCLLFESSSSSEKENEGGVEKVKHKITGHKAAAAAAAEEEQWSDDDDDSDAVEEEEASSDSSPPPSPSPSPPPKKKKKRVVKATSTTTLKKWREVLKCQVEGCEEDISGSKVYYRNHKICEVHFKSPVVRVGGARERFCQQCTRFHELLEFDGSKRACRKSLEAHNKRRRTFILPELDDADTELVLGFQDLKDNSRMNVDQSGKRKADLSLRPTFKHFKLR